MASQSHEYAADGQTIVDDGTADDQSRLQYNASAAASATPYDARKQRSVQPGAPGLSGLGALHVPTLEERAPTQRGGHTQRDRRLNGKTLEAKRDFHPHFRSM